MIWALLACFIVVAFLMIVSWRPKAEKVNAVEYSAQLEDARKVAPWVRGPAPMPSGWTATSVEFRAPEQRPITWHLGIVTNEKKYVGLEQSNVTGPTFQSDKMGRTTSDGTSHGRRSDLAAQGPARPQGGERLGAGRFRSHHDRYRKCRISRARSVCFDFALTFAADCHPPYCPEFRALLTTFRTVVDTTVGRGVPSILRLVHARGKARRSPHVVAPSPGGG